MSTGPSSPGASADRPVEDGGPRSLVFVEPVKVEIVAHAPTEFFHCQHCELVWQQTGMSAKIHAEQREAGLPADLAEQYAAVGAWVEEITASYGECVQVRVIDVLSLEGFFKCVRYRLGRFPAYIVDGRPVGDGIEAAARAVEQGLVEAHPAERRGG